MSSLAASSFAFNPFPITHDEFSTSSGMIGRVTVDRVAPIYRKPEFHSGVIRYTRRDELINIYYQLEPDTGPSYNPVWYRVWGGYIHRAYVQTVNYRFNNIVHSIPEHGQLAEVTVPFTAAFSYNQFDGWKQVYRLYYETTHWITGIDEGPDGSPWYRITSELDKSFHYFVPARHMRTIPDSEIAPLSPELPYTAKRIEVDLAYQTLTAYEYDQPVYTARISSGSGSADVPDGTKTPSGQFHITSKMPTKHMGDIRASGAPDSYILPGVPWTSFFIFETGVAFHGTFWHHNFGVPMSHGCVNMNNPDAKWLFRWVTPEFDTPIENKSDWDVRGYGTQVYIR